MGDLELANSGGHGEYNAGDADSTLAEGSLDGMADGVDPRLLAGIWPAEFSLLL